MAIQRVLLLFVVFFTIHQSTQIQTIPASRVVRITLTYPSANIPAIPHTEKWQTTMRKSILASLKFINKHWNICGTESSSISQKPSGGDCGKLYVTGETINQKVYRINGTFTAEADPVKNVKVDATSSLQSVIQIGLKGGIFQYTNSLKALGKPSMDLTLEQDYFCFPGTQKITDKTCKIISRGDASPFVGL
uniref:NTR domain-containing protein n=1 Tax=Rhabditophanes sp. KR3021 TaxID=114890 RepID=A0AC35TGB7_9BILA